LAPPYLLAVHDKTLTQVLSIRAV